MAQEPSAWERLKNLFRRPATAATTPPPAAPPKKAKPKRQTPVIKTPPVQPEPPTVLRRGKLSAASPPLPTPAPRQSTAIFPPRVPAASPGPSIDLVLGIDFGTSCTKVVIGDPGWKDQAFPVPFGNPKSNLASWLHPTKLANETNLKMRLMDTPDCPAVKDLVACYLATIITFAQAWFQENSSEDYRRGNWTWSLILGFPGKNVKSDSSLAAAYRSCVTVALQLTALAGRFTPEQAARFRTGEQEIETVIPPSRVHLYPEIAAQLAGYIKSPYCKKGNLLLIDVGAGTLDISTLIIHAVDAEEVVSFHVCDVKPLGVLRLYSARAEALQSINSGCVEKPVTDFQDGLIPIPESVDSMLCATFLPPSRRATKAFAEASSAFSGKILNTVLPCLTQFRVLQRNAHASSGFDPWPQNLRFFLTGGGSRADFYRRQLADGPLEETLVRFTRWYPDPVHRKRHEQGLQLETMPQPRNLVGFPQALSEHFDRLSVAYGLAQGADNLPPAR